MDVGDFGGLELGDDFFGEGEGGVVLGVAEEDGRVVGVEAEGGIGGAEIPDGEGGVYPATAQHAIREGPRLADNIVAVLRGKPTKPFRYSSLGMMAALGGRKAVAQLPGNYVITGFIAWFLWRTYYLLRLPGLDRKLRVAFDWTLDLLFPRDTAELRLGEREPEARHEEMVSRS